MVFSYEVADEVGVLDPAAAALYGDVNLSIGPSSDGVRSYVLGRGSSLMHERSRNRQGTEPSMPVLAHHERSVLSIGSMRTVDC